MSRESSTTHLARQDATVNAQKPLKKYETAIEKTVEAKMDEIKAM